jgi:hypothetical protein
MPYTVLLVSVLYVPPVVADEQMPRVDARRVVAVMAHMHPAWQFAVSKFI